MSRRAGEAAPADGGPRPRTSTFAPLRHRAFAFVWVGAFVSNIGTWMETVALGFWVEEDTGQALWPGIIAAAGFVPIAILGPIAGVVADRYSRRRTLALSTMVSAVVAGVLCALAAADGLEPPLVAGLVLTAGCASAIGLPTFQAMLPDLVPPDLLVPAIGLSSAQWNLGRVIGPLLAGVTLQVGGIAWALGVNAFSFLAVLASLLVVRVPPPPRTSRGSVWQSLTEGLAAVRSEPGMRVVTVAFAVNAFLAAPFIALIPAMAGEVLDGDETTISVLVIAQGIGAVAAALRLGGLTARFGSRRVISGSLLITPVLLVVYGAVPGTAGVAIALVALGAAYLVSLSSVTSIVQTRSPARLRGRTLSAGTVILGTLYPLGALVQGRLADAVGLRATTIGAGVVMAVVVWGTAVTRPGALRALDQPSALLEG